MKKMDSQEQSILNSAGTSDVEPATGPTPPQQLHLEGGTTTEDTHTAVGKAETPPPTYEDACRIMIGEPPLQPQPPSSYEPPPAYPDLDQFSTLHSEYVDMPPTTSSSDGQGQQDTIVLSTDENFPATIGLCKKIAVYLVAIFWISLSSIQLLLSVGVASEYQFEKFLYAGNNRAFANAIFMFWMVTLFANILLLSGIMNRNR